MPFKEELEIKLSDRTCSHKALQYNFQNFKKKQKKVGGIREAAWYTGVIVELQHLPWKIKILKLETSGRAEWLGVLQYCAVIIQTHGIHLHDYITKGKNQLLFIVVTVISGSYYYQ